MTTQAVPCPNRRLEGGSNYLDVVGKLHESLKLCWARRHMATVPDEGVPLFIYLLRPVLFAERMPCLASHDLSLKGTR